MNNLGSRYEEVKDYFRGLTVEDGICQVTIQLPPNWGMVDSPTDKIKTQPLDKSGSHLIVSELKDMDDIFDFIQYVVKVNKEVDIKKSLLKEKYNELISLFSERSVDELKTLTFKIAKQRGRKPKKSLDGVKPIATTPINDKDDAAIADDITSKNDSNVDNGDKPFIIKGSDIDKLGF